MGNAIAGLATAKVAWTSAMEACTAANIPHAIVFGKWKPVVFRLYACSCTDDSHVAQGVYIVVHELDSLLVFVVAHSASAATTMICALAARALR